MEQQHECPYCHKVIKHRNIFVNGREIWRYVNCECETNVALDEAENRKHSERQLIVEQLIESSGIPLKYRDFTFETLFDFYKEREKEAVNICQKFAEDFDKNDGEIIILHSKAAGVGKTYLACAIGNYIMEKYLKKVQFCRTSNLLLRIKGSYSGNGETEFEIMNELSEVPLLILDDMGKEKWSEWVETTMFAIIDNRYSNLKPMVITTNKTRTDLRNLIGVYSISRLMEKAQFISINIEQDIRELLNG